MQTALFNFDDLSLIIVMSSCLLFVFMLLIDKSKRRYNRWLSIFILSVALTCLNTVLYWSVPVKTEVESIQPLTYFILRVSPLLGAPALYIYTRSLVSREFILRRNDIVHFIPALLHLCAIPLIYLSLSEERLYAGIDAYSYYNDNIFFWSQTWLVHITELFYGYISLRVLIEHENRLKRFSSNLAGIDANWLKSLLFGFIGLWLLQTTAQIFAEFEIGFLAHAVSRTGTYFLFLLVTTLVVYSVTYSHTTHTFLPHIGNEDAVQEFTEEQKNRLLDVMKKREPYLDANLTLAELSKITSIPQRALSAIINRHCGVNFFDFVNEYRFKKAAQLLSDETCERNILEIMCESGFSSKSAFNRFFKKSTGMTPTQFQAKNNRKKSLFKKPD